MEKSRKELIAEYKRTKFRMGVYQIRNIKNGKVFIASAPDLDRVWNAKKFQLETNGHFNKALQQEWNEFGEKNFVFEILHELKSSDDPATNERAELKALEYLTIEEVQPFGDKGYNHELISNSHR